MRCSGGGCTLSQRAGPACGARFLQAPDPTCIHHRRRLPLRVKTEDPDGEELFHKAPGSELLLEPTTRATFYWCHSFRSSRRRQRRTERARRRCSKSQRGTGPLSTTIMPWFGDSAEVRAYGM